MLPLDTESLDEDLLFLLDFRGGVLAFFRLGVLGLRLHALGKETHGCGEVFLVVKKIQQRVLLYSESGLLEISREKVLGFSFCYVLRLVVL